MKATPKSCGCRQCHYARQVCKHAMKREERAFRHAMNQALRQGSEDIIPAGCRDRLG